jgi:hypothetical protein
VGKNVQQRLPCIMQTSNDFGILVRESGNILTDWSFLLRGTGPGRKTNGFGTLSNFECAKVAGRFNLLRVHDRPVQMSHRFRLLLLLLPRGGQQQDMKSVQNLCWFMIANRLVNTGYSTLYHH